MSKKSKILLIVGLIILIIIMIFPIFWHYGAGDVSGPNILQHPFLKSKVLCALVGGEYKRACIVKNETICKLKGGKILQYDPNGLSPMVVAPDGSCIK